MAEGSGSSSQNFIKYDSGNIEDKPKECQKVGNDFQACGAAAVGFQADSLHIPVHSDITFSDIAPVMGTDSDKTNVQKEMQETIAFESFSDDLLKNTQSDQTAESGNQADKDKLSINIQNYQNSTSHTVIDLSSVTETEYAKESSLECDAQERKFFSLFQSLKDKDYFKLRSLVTEHKIDINHTFTESFVELPYRGWRLIHMVCKEGNIIGLEALVSLGADTTAKTQDGDSALIISFRNGHYDCVRYLIKVSESLDDEETTKGQESIDTLQSNTAVVASEKSVLDNKGKNVETEKREDRYKELFDCLKDKEYVKLGALVQDENIDVDHTFTEVFVELPYRGWRLIHFACKRGNIDGLEIIISLGADPSAKTRNGDTALHISCKYGHYDCVKYLLKVSDHLKDIRNAQGLTPLMKALFRCDTVFKEKAYRKTIQVLIDSGCDVNLCPDSNVSPLHVVAGKWNSSYLMDMLIKAGADVNAIAAHQSPLMTALCRQKVDTSAVKLLIDSGADVNDKNLTGKSLLHIAVSKSEDKCVEHLLKAGADPNVVDGNGDSPLWIAVNENNIKIAPLLLRYGGNVNFCNTPYHMSLLCNAANRRYRKMVELLLDHDADVNTETALGASALHYAVDEGDREIMKMLLMRNCNMDNYSMFKDVYNPHNAFQIALEEGDDEVIKLLCQVGCPIPEFSLKHERLPRAVKDNDELIEWLYDFCYNPPTLLHMCRVEFRRLCGPRLEEVIDKLVSDGEIPHRLADCILMKDLLE